MPIAVKVSAVIIDEISTVKPYIIAYLNARLWEALPDIDKPFAGLAVLFFEDFLINCLRLVGLHNPFQPL